MMDPVRSLKQERPVAAELCIICQEDTGENVRTGGEQGKKALQATAQARTKLRDIKYRNVVACLDNVLAYSAVKIYYHKDCYTTFTSKRHIKRLETKQASSSSEPSTSTNQAQEPTSKKHRPSTVLRSSVASVNWNTCMFCQDTSRTDNLINVTTFNKSSIIILAASKYDQVLRMRLSGVHNLIAAEGKYHNSWLK